MSNGGIDFLISERNTKCFHKYKIVCVYAGNSEEHNIYDDDDDEYMKWTLGKLSSDLVDEFSSIFFSQRLRR